MKTVKSFSTVILYTFLVLGVLKFCSSNAQTNDEEDIAEVDEDIGKAQQGSKTDDEVVKREEEAINIDGLNVAQLKEMREKSEKFAFQAEVDKMMKLIINSLYQNKEIFLRELISNASDALDKIRFLSLIDGKSDSDELAVWIKTDRDSRSIHIKDSGVGMTKKELINNLGTIAKSGTADFLSRLTSSESKGENRAADLIGQFGVGFYSSLLVADRVTVVSKHDDDPEQHIWESDGSSFSVAVDPRGPTLKRGTEVILHLKKEADEYLEPKTLQTLVIKYSQFINFPIYMWGKTTIITEQPSDDDSNKDATGEAGKEPTKRSEDTVWDWKLINENKPIWTRKPADIRDYEYDEFFKSFAKTNEPPLTKVHFSVEGEVTFRSILFVPQKAPADLYTNPSRHRNNINMYVRRVFITDKFDNLMPEYLNFILGLVDSDDLPLNVSRETLQQNKLLKVIQKKLVRKTLDMFKKMSTEEFDKFWKEFSTNLKLGVVFDESNRTRLAKLLRFWSSHDDKSMVSLEEYVSRMKDNQVAMYYIVGQTLEELKKSPLVEQVLRQDFEVLYMVDPVDEFAIQKLKEFEGKKTQNVGLDGFSLDGSDKAKEDKIAVEKQFEQLTMWLSNVVLHDFIDKAEVSARLHNSPCAVVANSQGWTGNMERVMFAQATQASSAHQNLPQATMKKIFEINVRHPLIRKLDQMVNLDLQDERAKEIAMILYETAVLRSGYTLPSSVGFGERIERVLRTNLDIAVDEPLYAGDEKAGENVKKHEEEDEVVVEENDTTGHSEEL